MNIKWNINVRLNDIGNTVLLEINKFRINGNRVFSKCEYQNSISRHKDRMFLHIDNMLAKEGKMRPNMTLIDCSKGNSGKGEIKYESVITKGIQCRKFTFWNKRIIGDICLHIVA
ncbi:hypothetical protein C6H66_20115 [Photorhabdus hindustanensis]|uniref:Uncharacterized protein n=1 Tax=Photorhabdus hindustanensis TaxID=2918802 RepID=A0A2S8PWC7_9GAMM|nr:hypothetical protein [Photorhabdus hainanensis]PQQ23281.1 hypothetical protein C6H66_20115 [Photorhabdus hindustanensis]